jgi:hypothetical protein
MDVTAPFGNVAWMRSSRLRDGGMAVHRHALREIGRRLALLKNGRARIADRIGAALEATEHFNDVLCRDKLEKPVTVLMLMVSDEGVHPDLRRACAFALGSSGSRYALHAIENIMRYSGSIFPKLLAVKALGMLEVDERKDTLMDIADKNGSEEIRCAALSELARIDSRSARGMLFDEGTYPSWSTQSMRKINDALEGNGTN